MKHPEFAPPQKIALNGVYLCAETFLSPAKIPYADAQIHREKSHAKNSSRRHPSRAFYASNAHGHRPQKTKKQPAYSSNEQPHKAKSARQPQPAPPKEHQSNFPSQKKYRILIMAKPEPAPIALSRVSPRPPLALTAQAAQLALSAHTLLFTP